MTGAEAPQSRPPYVKPPWSQEQVDALNGFQRAGRFHPFTCVNRGDGKHLDRGIDLGLLVATPEGWVCEDCDYTQAWAHEFMLSPEAREPHPWFQAEGGQP